MAPPAAHEAGGDPGREENEQRRIGNRQACARQAEQLPRLIGARGARQPEGNDGRHAVRHDEAERADDVGRDDPRVPIGHARLLSAATAGWAAIDPASTRERVATCIAMAKMRSPFTG